MNKIRTDSILFSIVLIALATTGQAIADQDQYSFGQAFDFSKAVEITKKNFCPEQVGQRVAISGKITSVCEKNHCWMKLATVTGLDFRIKVDDQEMVFPISAKGKSVFAEGILEEWPQPDQAKHSYQLKAAAVFIVH